MHNCDSESSLLYKRHIFCVSRFHTIVLRTFCGQKFYGHGSSRFTTHHVS